MFSCWCFSFHHTLMHRLLAGFLWIQRSRVRSREVNKNNYSMLHWDCWMCPVTSEESSRPSFSLIVISQSNQDRGKEMRFKLRTNRKLFLDFRSPSKSYRSVAGTMGSSNRGTFFMNASFLRNFFHSLFVSVLRWRKYFE